MKKSRHNENERKRRRRAVHRPAMQFLKQFLYYKATGVWVDDPTTLHWHHRDPLKKFRKLCRLSARSPKRIADELLKCEVVSESEHRRIHMQDGGLE